MTRRTINKPAELSGIGLHKGRPARLIFRPAPGPTGLRFIGPMFPAPVPASLSVINGTARGTNLGSGAAVIYTVEHPLSAAAGLGIDDLDIELDGAEPPAMDGSALPYAEALLAAGITGKPGQSRAAARLRAPVELERDGGTYYRAAPAGGPLRVRLVYDHPHRLVGRQEISFTLSPENYLREAAPARTFGFSAEVAALKAAGLALGGSLDNAIIIGDEAVQAKGGLRFPDEFARHKLLDLIGDLSLAGLPLEGMEIEAVRPGHAGNVNFAKLLVENSEPE